MKKHLLLFAVLLLSWMARAQSIEVTPDTLSFEYAEGHDPTPQSFTINYQDLTSSMIVKFQNAFNPKFQISKTQNDGFGDSIRFSLDELLGGEVDIFVRMKEGLTPGNYRNTILIDSRGAQQETVQCSGIVNGRVNKPQFTPIGNDYYEPVSVTITCDEGASIYYTTDGEDPDESSFVFNPDVGIPINKTTTLKAIGKKENWNDSEIASEEYHIQYHIYATVSPRESGHIIYNGQYMAYLDRYIDSDVGSITLQADPENNYSFEYWIANNDTINVSSCEIPVDTAYNLIAKFKINNGNINTHVYPESAGYVNIEGSYEIGQTAKLTAIPNPCYIFKQWNDGNIDNPRNIVVAQTNDYTAIFELANYTIIGRPNNESWGSVIVDGTSFHCEDVTKLEAIPEEGYEFEKWDDDNTDNPRYVEVNSDSTFTAIFAVKSIRIDIIADPEEGGLVSQSGSGIYDYGDTCTLTASPNAGYSFSNWMDSDNVVVSSELIYSFPVKKDDTYTAHFVQQYTVTTSVTPVGAGTVEGDTICPAGTMITLKAIANENYFFEKWDDGNTDNSRTVIVTCDLEFVAIFKEIPCIDNLQEIAAKEHKEGDDTYILILVYPNPNDEEYEYQWQFSTDSLYFSDLHEGTYNKQYYYKGGRLTEGFYKVRVTQGDCSAETKPYHVTYSGNTIRIYPNPSRRGNNITVVNDNDSPAQLAIYSTDGRLLYTQTITSDQANIGVTLPQGVYVAYLTNKDGYTKVGKLIIH